MRMSWHPNEIGRKVEDMKNDLMQIGKRYVELESEFLVSLYSEDTSGIDIELNIVDVITDELLDELEPSEVKRALTHMFLLGQITREGNHNG